MEEAGPLQWMMYKSLFFDTTTTTTIVPIVVCCWAEKEENVQNDAGDVHDDIVLVFQKNTLAVHHKEVSHSTAGKAIERWRQVLMVMMMIMDTADPLRDPRQSLASLYNIYEYDYKQIR